jgi:hypothetical protein
MTEIPVQVFWLMVAALFYTYAGFTLLVGVFVRLRNQTARQAQRQNTWLKESS